MERESFEDEEVAALLNESFVAIKVDREERPDIDHLYMTVCQALTGSRGWPLTVLLTPDQKPFFAGTYFPKRRVMGRSGLMEILTQVRDMWKQDPGELEQVGEKLRQVLTSQEDPKGTDGFTEALPKRAYEQFSRFFDGVYGGFGRAPKFPSPHNLLFLFRYADRYNERHAADMALHTLDRIAVGGIRDHIGGGFARYSTDERWLVPHFEKMLYDNALLLMAYTEAWLIDRKPGHAEAAEEIVTYILRDMTGPEGEFYSAEDADSEGVEGKFYVWTPEQIRETLGEADADIYCRLYGITEEGNFEGASIPNLLEGTLEERAAELNLPAPELKVRVKGWHARLLAKRCERPRPYRDDKVLTAWNGLMIAALGKAAFAFNRSDWSAAAEKAARFLQTRLVRQDGRLLARYRDGEAAYPGYLDDYACLALGLTELFQATGKVEYLKNAVQWTEETIRLFRDEAGGTYHFTGHDAERLLIRPKETYDGAMPSGNSVITYVLLRLAAITGDEKLRQEGLDSLSRSSGAAVQTPTGHSMLMCAGLLALGGGMQVVIAGRRDDEMRRRMHDAVREGFLPDAAILEPGDPDREGRLKLMPLLADKLAIEGRATAYVCRDFACRRPVHSTEELLEQLQESKLQADPQ